MKVCIAEKPSVAREIADLLGAKNRKDGYFEGNGYQVTWTIGHLCTLKEPQDYDAQLKWWNIQHLPILPPKFGIKGINNPGIEKQLKTITKLVNEATEVINCGDAGQEGELIQRWVLTKANCTKPVKRLWISSLTEEAMKEGFRNLKDSKEYDLLYAAGSSRAIGDWLLGINATRLYTLKYAQGKQLLSIGRVQTPTLALIVNRYLEIENFKPQTYWELKTIYRDVVFSAKNGKFNVKEDAEQILQDIQNELFTIISFTRKKGKESAPKLFDLTSLQVECNKKFGYSADLTLNTVQNLYEKKLVTYPRVDTMYLPDDIYPKIKGILSSMSGYAALTQPLLGSAIKKSKNVFDDKKVTDHHAIIPTNIKAGSLGGYEGNVYDLIARRFIAAFYPDCQVSKTEVIGKVKDTEFKATGKQILEEGWRAVYKEEKKEEDTEQDDDQILPEFKEGESGPHKPTLAEKQTKPPKHYTEATLLRAMETAGKQIADEELREAMKENGIGRPSTRANIIETLFKRNYIKKEKKNLIPTITGVQLIQTIDYELLKSAELTGKWEKKLRDIEKGTFDARVFLSEMKHMVMQIVHHVKNSNARKIAIEVKSAEPEQKKKSEDKEPKPKSKKAEAGQDADVKLSCPKCKKGQMMKGKKAFGCSEYKNGCSFLVPFELFGKTLSDKQLQSLIKSGKTPNIKGLKKESGEETEGIIKLDDQLNPVIEEKQAEALICPKCKKGAILEGKAAYGCAEWKSGCNFRIPLLFMQKEINKNHLKALISGKETSVIKGLTDESGAKTNAKLKLGSSFSIEISHS
ncbi:type IA DNA topoisomerase [Sporocytophaga myxococcoides]|uniref:type IA DNA topoisomerase n=1 Tax=Sporocytophaga myxococcoides TaxID=153721 RepID=UPI0004109A44|nr:type IA DNA topoisomerase [Sporocytophaga myxococcoides]